MGSVNPFQAADYLTPTNNLNFPASGTGGSMIDPGTATLIGAGVSAIGSGVGGVASGKGAKSAAEQAREAAAEQAKMVVQANRENLFGGFALEDLAQQQEMAFGGPRNRFGEFENRQFASSMAFSPSAQARDRLQTARSLAERQAALDRAGFSPMARFV